MIFTEIQVDGILSLPKFYIKPSILTPTEDSP